MQKDGSSWVLGRRDLWLVTGLVLVLVLAAVWFYTAVSRKSGASYIGQTSAATDVFAGGVKMNGILSGAQLPVEFNPQCTVGSNCTRKLSADTQQVVIEASQNITDIIPYPTEANRGTWFTIDVLGAATIKTATTLLGQSLIDGCDQIIVEADSVTLISSGGSWNVISNPKLKSCRINSSVSVSTPTPSPTSKLTPTPTPVIF